MNLDFKGTDIDSIIMQSHHLLYEGSEDDKYHKSYYFFVKFFQDKEVLDEQDLIIGANFVYGWMPTILNFKTDKFKECISIINHAKTNDVITKNQFKLLKGLINNSAVGASKLLHFINPSIYPIWDSRVYRSLFDNVNINRINNENSYWDYFDMCHQTIHKLPIEEISEKFSGYVGYEVSSVRTFEQILFYYSRFMDDGE